MKNKNERLAYRKRAVTARVLSIDPDRKRVMVKRTLNHIYAVVIDDTANRTLFAVSTLSAELKGKLKATGNVQAAKEVGALLAAKLKEKNISKIYFDRGGRKYHGRVKAVAEALRAGGMVL